MSLFASAREDVVNLGVLVRLLELHEEHNATSLLIPLQESIVRFKALMNEKKQRMHLDLC